MFPDNVSTGDPTFVALFGICLWFIIGLYGLRRVISTQEMDYGYKFKAFY